MKKKRQRILILSLIVVLSNIANAGDLDVWSLIRNDSDEPWTVKFMMPEGGYVDFNSLSDCKKNQDCIVEANNTKIIMYNIDYSKLADLINPYTYKGIVIITDYLGNRKIYNLDLNGTSPVLSPTNNDCPDDVEINVSAGNSQGGMTFKYPSLCWPGHL